MVLSEPSCLLFVFSFVSFVFLFNLFWRGFEVPDKPWYEILALVETMLSWFFSRPILSYFSSRIRERGAEEEPSQVLRLQDYRICSIIRIAFVSINVTVKVEPLFSNFGLVNTRLFSFLFFLDVLTCAQAAALAVYKLTLLNQHTVNAVAV